MSIQGLPTPIKLHAINTIAIGVGLTFFPTVFIKSPPVVALARLFKLPVASEAAISILEEQHWTDVGLLMVAVGSLYIPFWNKSNRDFERFSTRLRIALAGLTAFLWFMKPQTRNVFKAGLLIEDGLSGLVAWWLLKDGQ